MNKVMNVCIYESMIVRRKLFAPYTDGESHWREERRKEFSHKKKEEKGGKTLRP